MKDTVRLTEQDMQTIMGSLFFTGDESDESAELHDRLVNEGFSRFDNKKMADLVVLDPSEPEK